MEDIGIDVHKKESQICILSEGASCSSAASGPRPDGSPSCWRSARGRGSSLEASTESEWVARGLEGLGHEVIVADPNFAPMDAARSRKVKTDRRDARALAEACRLGADRLLIGSRTPSATSGAV